MEYIQNFINGVLDIPNVIAKIFGFIQFLGVKTLLILLVGGFILYKISGYLREVNDEKCYREFWSLNHHYIEQEIETFCGFAKLNQDFRILDLLNENFKDPKNCNILELGTGSSKIINSLYDNGFKKITATDFSYEIVDKMKEKYAKKTNINYMCVDFRRLVEYFSENTFDVIFDKGSLDCINKKYFTYYIDTLYDVFTKQIFKVLKPNGMVITISERSRDEWNKIFSREFSLDKFFDLVDVKESGYVADRGEKGKMYFYYLKRRA